MIAQSQALAIPLLFLLAGTNLSSPSAAQDCALCEHSSPEFWVVNSRCAPRCNNLDEGFEALTYKRWCAESNCFVDQSRETLLEAQAQLPTLIFVHGNSLDHKHAMKSAWKIYERLRVCPGPKLFVFWSWPAEWVHKRPLITPIKLVRKNIRTKYNYSERQGYYLAKLAQQMSTELPLTLGGHSFGATCSVVAAHYLGGGRLNGQTLAGGSPDERINLRLSLISPAMDNDHLYPGHRYEMAAYPVEKIHTTYNTKDATLKRWPIQSCRAQQAMGYTGICASRLEANSHKLCQQLLTEDVGRSHYMKEHLASARMISQVCQTAFGSSPTGSCTCGGSPKRVKVDVENILKAPARAIVPSIGL